MPPLASALTLVLVLSAVATAGLLAPIVPARAASTRTQRQQAEQELRNLPSPLPAGRVNKRAGSMKAEPMPMKRSPSGGGGGGGGDLQASNSSTNQSGTSQKKRFRTSNRAFESKHHHQAAVASATSRSESGGARTGDLWRNRTDDSNDLNNNSIPSDDNNNNNNNNNGAALPNWRRNVDSVNGTVDLSQYERNDIDRLYGDALLVYFKNFNETLPARRELITIHANSTATAPSGSRNRIPIYQSVPTDEPK